MLALPSIRESLGGTNPLEVQALKHIITRFLHCSDIFWGGKSLPTNEASQTRCLAWQPVHLLYFAPLYQVNLLLRQCDCLLRKLLCRAGKIGSFSSSIDLTCMLKRKSDKEGSLHRSSVTRTMVTSERHLAWPFSVFSFLFVFVFYHFALFLRS